MNSRAVASHVLNIADVEMIDLAERARQRGSEMPTGRYGGRIGPNVGDAVHPIRAGDVIACPPGGPQTARQLVNTGHEALRFFAVSTMTFPEICEYPNSKKLNAITGMGPHDFRHIARHGEGLDYWDGEA